MNNHLFIGLGGQGARTLSELLKVMEQRHEDRDELKNGPVNWDFLSIDSSSDVWDAKKDWKYFGKDLRLTEAQRFPLKPVSVAGKISELSLRPDIAPWIGDREAIEKYLEGEGGREGGKRGANQRRRFGRLLLANAAASLETDLQSRVRTLTEGRDNSCTFHVFASVAGGTGSGGIVDLVAMIRNEFQNPEKFPVYVHVYATSKDEKGAGVGYFFQNQYATLRDLNALMCSRLKPNLLGNNKQGREFAETTPINAVSLATNFNSDDQRLSLDDQIRITAECCFERIYAFATGALGADAQKSLTLEDIVSTWPGEPIPSMERSYRFSSLGMRRWEVPNEKIEELIALDLICASLRQMLANNWQQNAGFSAEGPDVGDGQREANLGSLGALVDARLISEAYAGELKRDLATRFEQILKGTEISEGALPQLEQAVNRFYAQDFQSGGVESYFGGFAVRRNASAEDLKGEMDLHLTAAWLDRAAPLGLSHAIEIVDFCDSQLRAKLDAYTKQANDATAAATNLEGRKREWQKMTGLSRRFRAMPLMRAHLSDLLVDYSRDIDTRAIDEDRAFLSVALDKLSELRSSLVTARSTLEVLLERFELERSTIDSDLRKMRKDKGANNYEFDDAALDNFRKVLDRHEDHQRMTSDALRALVCTAHPGTSLTRFRGREEAEREELDDRLRDAGLQSASNIHSELCRTADVTPVLGESLMDRLEKRFAGDEGTLQEAAKTFVRRAASCALKADGEHQPATILGANVGVQDMPKRLFLLGVPRHPYAATITAALKNAVSAGSNYVYDLYEHDEQSQLRLMIADYWMAARFAAVTRELNKHYEDALEGVTEQNVPYFCNIDPDGEQGRRPSLLLPSGDECRERLAAGIWLGERLSPPAFEQGDAGFCLVRVEDGRTEVDPVGTDRDALLNKADLPMIYKVDAEISNRLASLSDDERTALRDKVAAEEQRVIDAGGRTGSAFQEWQKTRDQIDRLI